MLPSMLKYRLIGSLLVGLLLATGCRTTTGVSVSLTPPTRVPPPAVTTASVGQLPSPTFPPPQPSATPVPLTPPAELAPATPVPTPAMMKTYWSQAGRFILQYPQQAKFYEEQVPSVNGVLAPVDDTVAIHSPNQDNYLLTLAYFDLEPGVTLTDFINAHSQCAEVTGPAERTYTLSSQITAGLFPDTNCGPQGSSYLFFIQGDVGYRFTITGADRFLRVEPYVRPILSSFQSFADVGLPDAPPLRKQPALPASLPVIEPDNVAQLAALARLGKGAVRDVAWAPDGRTFVAATPLGLHFYQAGALTEQKFLPTASPALAVAVSPDGESVAAALADFAIHLWEMEAPGRPLHIFTGHSGPVNRIAFSPDGRRLVSIAGDNLLRIWHAQTRQLLTTHFSHPYARLAFSPDGRWLAVGSGKFNRQVQVVDLKSGEEVAFLEVQPDLLDKAFSPDGQTLALLPSGQPDDHSLLLWEFAAGQSRRLPYHQTLYSVAFSPDGSSLVTGDLDGRVQVWDVATGQVKRVLAEQGGSVRSLSFSPDGAFLAAGDGAGLKIWEMAGGAVTVDLAGFRVAAPAFSPDNRYLIFRRGGTVGQVDLATGERLLLPGHSDLLTALAYSDGGRWLAAGDRSGLVHLWDMAGGRPAQVLSGHAGPVGHLAFSADGQRLHTGGLNEDRSVNLWAVPEVIQAEPGAAQPQDGFSLSHDQSLLDLALSPDGNTLAVATLEGVMLRDLDSGRERQFIEPRQRILSIVFSPDGRRLASGSFGDTVLVWDVASGQPLHNLIGPQLGGIAELIFTPNGRWLIAGGQQNRIYGWEVETEEVAQQIEGRGVDLALNPAGRLLAFKKTLDEVIIGDIFAAREAIQFPGERPLAFSADGRLLAVGSDDGVITLWGIP